MAFMVVFRNDIVAFADKDNPSPVLDKRAYDGAVRAGELEQAVGADPAVGNDLGKAIEKVEKMEDRK